MAKQFGLVKKGKKTATRVALPQSSVFEEEEDNEQVQDARVRVGRDLQRENQLSRKKVSA
jgi:hypothetical protein